MAKKEKLSLEELLEQAIVKDEEKPYEVPGNWVWTRLGGILKEIKNGTTMAQNKDKVGLLVTRIESIQNNKIDFDRLGYIADVDNIKESDFYIDGNIALSHINSVEHVGKTAIITSNMLPMVHGMNLLRLTFNNACNPYYFQYISQSFDYKQEIVVRINMAVNQVSINQKQLQSIPIPLPPLAEQQRIVALIESLFEKLDRAKELAQNALDSFENRKSAILHKAFTGELTRKWREENGVSFENDWTEKALGNCGEWSGGGTPSKGNPAFWVDGSLLWVTPKDMKSIYIDDTEDKITEIAVNNSSAKLIQNDAILFVVRSGILRRILPIAITTKPVTVNQDMKAIIPKGINVKFLYWCCVRNESDIRDKCAKSGTTVESISSELLYKYKILLPRLPEQKEIVHILDNLLENEQKSKELCDVIDKIDHMKKSILARAFRGELSTNNPDEESALELLKEVLKEKV